MNLVPFCTNQYIFQAVNKIEVVLYSILFGMLLFTVISKTIINKKFDIISLIVLILLTVIIFIKTQTLTLFYVVLLLLYLYLIFINLHLAKSYIYNRTIKNKVLEHVKSDTSDFYFCTDLNNKILDYSQSFMQLTKLNKTDILKKDGWQILFDEADIKKINGSEFIISNAKVFLAHLDEIVSKYKMYQFDIDIRLKDQTEITHYIGLAQAIYFKEKKIATAIYLYSDKVSVLTTIKQKLDKTLDSLFNYKNIVQILMSLSEGVCLYFDYQERLYYATQSFKNFMNNDISSYTFQDVFEMIVAEDKEQYIEQSETINSASVTRIKFKIVLNNVCYQAIEDSIYLSKDGKEFVSVIHIIGKENSYVTQGVLSTKESIDLLTEISSTPITPVVYAMEDILNKVLGDEEDEK